MPKRTLLYTAETVYGNYSFLSEKTALFLEKIAYTAMIDHDLELKQTSDDHFRFKVTNRYDLEFSPELGLRFVEEYDPEPYVSTKKVLNLYDKGLNYELDRGVVSISLIESTDLVQDFKRYLALVKEI